MDRYRVSQLFIYCLISEVKLELPFLMEKLKGCKASWFHLGVGLGVNEAELKKFQNEKKNNGILQCFSDTLTFWLNSGEADLNTLVKAVELSGHKRLAADIKLKYQGTYKSMYFFGII